MATKDTEKKDVLGLEQAANRKDAEYDLVKSLLEAASYKTADESVTEVEIRRAGKFLFTVHIHPISEADLRQARKNATKTGKNPNGKGYAPIELGTDSAMFSSWLIYLATTEEDQAKIWGNPAVMKAHSLLKPAESVDLLLTYGEKKALADKVLEISGFDEEDEDMSEEEFRGDAD